MTTLLDSMLARYNPQTTEEQRHAFREITQEVVLCGLARAGFFKQAAFYGGTALRIFYGLDRFSEDMDFSLAAPDDSFALEAYLPTVVHECEAWGLHIEIGKQGRRESSAIESAFLKANTKQHILSLFAEESASASILPSEVLKIKLEVDTDPAPHASFERHYRLLPMPFEALLYDQPSLFAGKAHALICRTWKNRTKGRDLYDYVFYLARNTLLNLAHLGAKLQQSGHINNADDFTLNDAKQLLCERLASINYEQAKDDVRPFLANPTSLDVWSADFFCAITQDVQSTV